MENDSPPSMVRQRNLNRAADQLETFDELLWHIGAGDHCKLDDDHKWKVEEYSRLLRALELQLAEMGLLRAAATPPEWELIDDFAGEVANRRQVLAALDERSVIEQNAIRNGGFHSDGQRDWIEEDRYSEVLRRCRWSDEAIEAHLTHQRQRGYGVEPGSGWRRYPRLLPINDYWDNEEYGIRKERDALKDARKAARNAELARIYGEPDTETGLQA